MLQTQHCNYKFFCNVLFIGVYKLVEPTIPQYAGL
jgi:hypothetical protein